ncbi:MAG: Ig domain-containing protein, partial [Bacteroidaceae bacterium]|nr:Ig domain-containing protein [Bacteroidaceae bacterium]
TSNDAVCMVSNTGKVVATGEGSAVITVKTEDGSFTASCNVRVSISHPVTGITLNQESITFDGIGQSAQLVATVVPNEATEKGVTWSSSNESVCMVSSTGFIVAVGNGTADITATTIDGGFTATCKVKVEDITPVSSVDAKAQGYKVYDLQGRERNRLQKGINIIRFSDGTTKKVLVK